tara:strand:+ start:1256 stop:1594 length:339 start_codon:yes stop_codon:yes gene_type:complete
LRKFKLHSSQNNIKNVKFLFITFLLIFISHFVYNNLKVIYLQNNIEVTDIINDFDSEQENNETNEEYEEFDEYLVSDKDDLFPSYKYKHTQKNINQILLNQYFEIDSPPPIC